MKEGILKIYPFLKKINKKDIYNNMSQVLAEDVYDIDFLEDQDESFDPLFEASYLIFKECFHEQFQNAIKIDKKLFSPVTFKTKTFQKYIEKFNRHHQESLSPRSTIVKEMYLLYHTSRCMYRYNEENLHLSYIQFRSHFYFPNIIFLLVRYLQETRTFLQKTIRAAYYLIQKKNERLIYLFENSIYTDVDVIRTDVLYTFLGNSVKKINPYEVKNITAFYRQVFLNHFFYYFRCEQKIHSKVIEEISTDTIVDEEKSTPTRESLYKNVLTNLQVESYKDISPTMKQLHYNYNIFKNVIINNEFQSLYLSSQPSDKMSVYCNLDNSQYKVLSLYDKIMSDEEFVNELRKLPTIYKLLKSVHLITKNVKTRLSTVRREVVVSAVADELAIPFRNLLNSDTSSRTVLLKIADNFVNSILIGEYISLQTLAPINIDTLSFVQQLRKFIKLCTRH